MKGRSNKYKYKHCNYAIIVNFLRNQPSPSRKRPATPVNKLKARHEMGKKQKIYDQKFKEEWLELPQFAGWLKKHPSDNFLCLCTVCNSQLRCGKSELEKHAGRDKHKKNVAIKRNVQPVQTFFESKTLHSRKVSEAEIKLAALFAHHNLAFQVVEHLVPVLKECFPDSKIAKDIKLGRTKATNIVKNVIGKKEIDNLASILQKTHFSVLIDESTDISVNKLLCINVKYIDENGIVCDRLLELLSIDAKNANAENLFIAFKNCMETKNISLKNIIGFACDNANVMIGKNNSFMTRLQEETDALVVMRCICHSSALVASKACSKLPRTPEDFIKNVASHFSSSAKRTAELVEMQNFFQMEQKKMLKLSTTRWLSMQHAIKRVLENWQVLNNHFQIAKVEENSKSVNMICDEFNNSVNKAILFFLDYFLNFFNTFNALFQSKKILIQDLSKNCKKIFKQVISHFILPEYVNDFKITCNNPRNYIDLKQVDLGQQCNTFILDLPEDIQMSIRKYCLEFMISAATDIQIRFPLTDIFFDSLQFLNPHIALSINKPLSLISLEAVWSKFTSIDGICGSTIDREWKNLAVNFDEIERETFLKLSVEGFWSRLAHIKDFNDELEYAHLVKLARLCLILPHSNAETERVFSVVTDVKTKKRNKISSDALNAVSVIRFSSDNCCQQFQVTNDHLKLMTSKNLY